MTRQKTRWTLEELVNEARARFGDDPLTWAFQCPHCKDVATAQDFKDAGADPNRVVRAIEGFLGTSADGNEVRRLWRRAYERRTGQVELPLEVERELEFLGRDDE